MTRNSFTHGVVLATLAILGTVGAAAAQPGFPATSFLTPAKATWESTRNLVIAIVDYVRDSSGIGTVFLIFAGVFLAMQFRGRR